MVKKLNVFPYNNGVQPQIPENVRRFRGSRSSRHRNLLRLEPLNISYDTLQSIRLRARGFIIRRCPCIVWFNSYVLPFKKIRKVSQ